MAPAASPLRDKALKAWLKSGKTKKLVDIANWLGISPGQVRKWKHEYNWDAEPLKKPKGAPIGNKNAVGNVGGDGAPLENQFAVTHGLFRKYMPEELRELAEDFDDKDPLDMLWDIVTMWFAKIAYSQSITFVKDKLDETKVIKKTKSYSTEDVSSEEIEYEIQHAWDKENSTIKALATATKEFRAAVRSFQSAAPEDDERRLKLEIMQLQASKTRAEIDIIKKDSKPLSKKDPNELTEAELDAEIARLSAIGNGSGNKTKAL